jgi:outer membrane protein W
LRVDVIGADEDDHKLRNKLSMINSKGNTFIGCGIIDYQLSKNIFFEFNFSYIEINTKGEQTQKNYEGEVLYDHINAKLNSLQKYISIGISYHI